MNNSTALQTVGAYLRLMRFDRPIGTLLLLWPTLWALWLAQGGLPPLSVLLIFVAGVVVMRACGCVINDYADRGIDGRVTRTKARPLATGEVSAKGALILFAVLGVVAFILVCFLNVITLLYALPALGLVVFYPFTKRFFPLPQFVLGLAFSWAIPMAYAAILGSVTLVGWLLFAANLCWVIAYDTQYAMMDREDDLKLGVLSSAILFGRFDRACIVFLQIMALTLLGVVGGILRLNLIYYCTIFIAAAFMAYQFCLIYGHNPGGCFRAFLNNNWVGAIIFLGMVLGCVQ